MTEPPKCSLCKLVEGKSPVRSSGKTIYDHAQADCQPLNRRQVPHTNSPPSRYPLPRSVASSVCSTHTELAPQAGLSQGGGPSRAFPALVDPPDQPVQNANPQNSEGTCRCAAGLHSTEGHGEGRWCGNRPYQGNRLEKAALFGYAPQRWYTVSIGVCYLQVLYRSEASLP